MNARDIEKPNVSGWSANRRLRIVDFPEPDGPDITIGRWSWVAVGQCLSHRGIEIRMLGLRRKMDPCL